MKKNNMLRIASVLLVAVLLSTCAISGAFAKYITSDDAYEDSARVAKFGVTVETSTTGNLFVNAEGSEGQFTVKGDADADVIAPGMGGNLTNAITITDEADREVAVKVITVATFDLGDNWVAGGEYYCPITIKIGDTTTIKGTTYTSAGEFEAAVLAELNDEGTTYYVGQSAAASSIPAISWSWDFTGNDDTKDTELGKNFNAEIELTLDITVEQAD